MINKDYEELRLLRAALASSSAPTLSSVGAECSARGRKHYDAYYSALYGLDQLGLKPKYKKLPDDYRLDPEEQVRQLLLKLMTNSKDEFEQLQYCWFAGSYSDPIEGERLEKHFLSQVMVQLNGACDPKIVQNTIRKILDEYEPDPEVGAYFVNTLLR